MYKEDIREIEERAIDLKVYRKDQNDSFMVKIKNRNILSIESDYLIVTIKKRERYELL